MRRAVKSQSRNAVNAGLRVAALPGSRIDARGLAASTNPPLHTQPESRSSAKPGSWNAYLPHSRSAVLPPCGKSGFPKKEIAVILQLRIAGRPYSRKAVFPEMRYTGIAACRTAVQTAARRPESPQSRNYGFAATPTGSCARQPVHRADLAFL
jgi:hypothetical protein